MLPRVQLLSLVTASLASPLPLEARGGICEPLGRICYGAAYGTSQNLNESDIKYVAQFLRHHGRNYEALFTVASGFTCREWAFGIPGSGTVLVLAKHVDPRVNSSVSFEDIANTIDGGENASKDDRAGSILGCGNTGGSRGVQVNSTSSVYNTDDYRNSHALPRGIIVKLVRQDDSDPEE
ncbi:hypothetical protein G6O67_006298 [Ophiocordyceps sinensis]|uniref:Killer toxin Kp4 domain-containing protein n=2 Tax=Ophiocordyceps sinensis TaxID=72228 RepID=A0A8H4LV59_9HYPO|nr:hypothetical protein OCS_01740 [Ophiocordyceps sinensis CO18]KAF4506193.1 hypothetical protein G6O67_006298 [Ophiocordyceps sinensis]